MRKIKKTTIIEVLLVVAVLAQLPAAMIAHARYYRSIAPPPGGFIDQCAAHSPIERILELQRDGTTYYLAEGEAQPFYVLASGRPLYLFDSRGQLVEWIKDSGESSSPVCQWDRASAREVSLDSVLLRIGRGAQADPPEPTGNESSILR